MESSVDADLRQLQVCY